MAKKFTKAAFTTTDTITEMAAEAAVAPEPVKVKKEKLCCEVPVSTLMKVRSYAGAQHLKMNEIVPEALEQWYANLPEEKKNAIITLMAPDTKAASK